MSEGQVGQEGQPGVDGGGQGGRGGTGGAGEPLDALRTPKLIFLGCLLVISLSLIGTIMYAAHLNGERRASAVATCERGNIVRAKQNALILYLNEKLAYTGTVTPLVVCSAIK